MPVPKVIDFGIAKATGERLTDKTVLRPFEQFIGTPAYMSPEQAELSGTGHGHAQRHLQPGGAALRTADGPDAVRRQKRLRRPGWRKLCGCIREEEPPKPSTRLSSWSRRNRLTTAQRRATEPPKLIRSLRGDLDWIVMKCLEKNRTRRYATANELARDIESHLKHEPVSAAAPTLGYRADEIRSTSSPGAGNGGSVCRFCYCWGRCSACGRPGGRRRRRKNGQNLRNVKWALETVLPEVERSFEKNDITSAFKLLEQARPFVADNRRFQALSARVVGLISVETTPPGAQVFIKNYTDLDAKWEPVGKSPINATKVAQGLKRWKIIMPEYERAEGTLFASFKPVELNVKLRLLAANGRAQTFTTLHSFTATFGSDGCNGTNSDGVLPYLGTAFIGQYLVWGGASWRQFGLRHGVCRQHQRHGFYDLA